MEPHRQSTLLPILVVFPYDELEEKLDRSTHMILLALFYKGKVDRKTHIYMWSKLEKLAMRMSYNNTIAATVAFTMFNSECAYT